MFNYEMLSRLVKAKQEEALRAAEHARLAASLVRHSTPTTSARIELQLTGSFAKLAVLFGLAKPNQEPCCQVH